MVKIIIYTAMILLIVGLGLYLELNSGDYLLIERKAAASPAAAPKK
jgi:hypothetical protein